MRDIKVASRYAKSLLLMSIDENILEEVYNDMKLVNSTCIENRELTLLLKSPIVKADKKNAILAEIFNKKVSIISSAFISIILSKKREGILPDIANSFIEAYKIHNNITTASVTTAVPLTKDQKTVIIALIKKQGKSNVELQEVVNEEVIGGMVLRIGDKQIDESIKKKLTNLEMEFDDNLFIKEY